MQSVIVSIEIYEYSILTRYTLSPRRKKNVFLFPGIEVLLKFLLPFVYSCVSCIDTDGPGLNHFVFVLYFWVAAQSKPLDRTFKKKCRLSLSRKNLLATSFIQSSFNRTFVRLFVCSYDLAEMRVFAIELSSGLDSFIYTVHSGHHGKSIKYIQTVHNSISFSFSCSLFHFAILALVHCSGVFFYFALVSFSVCTFIFIGL